MARTDFCTRKELIVVFNLYLKLPFRKLHTGTRKIQELANLIGRSHNSMVTRLNNFAHVDPYHQQRGVKRMEGGRKQVELIWNEFINNQEELVFESEQILSEYKGETIEEAYSEISFDLKGLTGEMKTRLLKTRINQNIFRQMILKTYGNRCAVSGIDLPELLVAGHIVPWFENEHERLNPANGICLSNLYDQAYEKSLICIGTDYKLLISKRSKAESSKEFCQDFFGRFEHQPIRVPRTYQPKKEFLEYRLNRFEQ